MERKVERVISLLLSIVLTIQLLPMQAFAIENTQSAEEPQRVKVTAEKLTAYGIDTSTGEEIPGFSKDPFDLAQQKDWGTYEVVPAVWDENWEQRFELTTGTTEFFWCYAFDKSGFCPIGMTPGKWGELVQQHQEKCPEDYENIMLINTMDGWTTDPTIPIPCTVGELLGTDAPYYLPNYILSMYMRHTTEDGEVILLPYSALQGEVMVINSESEDGWSIPTESPYAVSATPLDWGYGNRGGAVSQLPESIPAHDGNYLTVCSNINEQETPVIYLPRALSAADGMVAPGAYCKNGLENGTCGCYSYLWVVPAKGDVFPDAEFITPRDFVPVGMDVMQWQDLCSVYEKEDPKAWASGDYTGLYSREDLNWSWNNRLPMCSEANISGVDPDHSDCLGDYQTRTYACVVRWEYCTYTVDEEDNWIENKVTRFGFSEPVTIVPMDSDGSGDPIDPDEPDDPDSPVYPNDPKYTPSTPLPEGFTRGLEWFGGVELACDASYEGATLSYQWFRSLTPDDDSDDVPFDDSYAHGTSRLCWAEFPGVDELDQTYYYYCEYSFTDRRGEVQTYRTTTCALRRAPCSMLEVKVSPGAFYLEKDPGNTDYYSPAYMRESNGTLPLYDPDDYTLTYAYQVHGGESVLSAWIETESSLSSSGFWSSDYVTWQWYKSPTEDWTQGEAVGDEGRVEGLTEISLSKPLVSGTQSVVNYSAFNKHANIHVDCPTDTLEPFYMTVVITNHYTNAQGEEVTSESIARCKVFTVEENEDLYSVDENGVLNGYNGHESVWNIPSSVDGKEVISIGVMAQTVRPPAGSDVRHHAGPVKIEIPEGVTEIGDNAFYRLYSLEEVVLPNTLKRIGRYAFGDTGTIERIDLPSSVEELAPCAFANARIQEFAFHPDVWPVIGGSAFSGSSIKQVIFPANATGTLNGYTFNNCTRLASVQNWTNIQDLDRYADFRYTPAYEYMEEGSSGDSDGSFIYQPDDAGTGWAVVQCVLEDTETVTIPASFKGKPVTTVGRGVAQNGTSTGATEQFVENVLSIKHLILPDTVHTIRRRAFDGCENLETVNFHDNISLVECEAFRNCYRLTSTVTLAAGAYIQEDAFIHCRSITRLDAPGAHIGNYAFAYCFNLEQISDYLPWLPDMTDLNAKVYAEGYVCWPFAYTKTYTDARESIQYYHTPDGEPDTRMAQAETGRRYGNVYYSVWANDRTKGNIEFYMGTEETNVYIPGVVPAADGDYEVTLVNVGSRIFEYMNTECYDVVFGEGISGFESASSPALKTTRMRHVTLPQSATDLGTFFQSEYGGTGLLESINIPSGIIRLEAEAFQGNKKLHTVTFEADSGLLSIGKSAFGDCSALREIDFSNLKLLETIGDNAFQGCDLHTVDLRACTRMTVLGRYAFNGMYNIRVIRLPDCLEEIGIFAFNDAAYRYGSIPEFLEVVDTLNPLQELVLPANLKKIGKGAFRGQFMDNAANEPYILELPETLEEIGSEAFGGYETNVRADMELRSNIILKDGKLPAGLKVFGCYSTAANDDDNGENMYSPFAYSPISTLTFPAGVEILGINACKMMPKLTTIVFETKEQTVPNNREPVQTGSMRELHPGSLDCGYVPDGWAEITDIRGFENLRLLEYAENVFGQTTQSWTYTGDSYTVPGSVKRLGQYALNNYGFSSLRNIFIEPGVEQIDQNAISKWAQQVGDYVTALDKAPRDTMLDERWLAVRYEEGATEAILRCYTGSAYHMWAEKYGCPYELLDGDARVLFLDLTLNGVPVPHPEQWLGTCQWTDSQGNPVGSEYIFREAREGETYTVTVGLNQEKLRGYALPTFTADVKIEAGQRYAYVQLPVSVRDSITVQGVLPQHGEPGFMAQVIQTHYPYAVITRVLPDAETGAFSVEIPVVDCKLVLTADEESAYVETVYKNFAMMGVYTGQTVDAGSIPMDLGVMSIIPISVSTSLRNCGALTVTDEAGNVYPAQLCMRDIKGMLLECLSIKSAIQAGVTIGDTLTLNAHVSDYTEETLPPYTFTVPAANADFFIEPVAGTVSRLLYQSIGYCYVYNQAGTCVARLYSKGEQINLTPGSYTVIQIDTTMILGLTLAEFLALDLPEDLYLRTDFTISEERNETFVLNKTCPAFDFGNSFGVQLTVGSTMVNADGYVPVYVQLNLTDEVPDGPVHFELQTDTDKLPFMELDGAFAIADQPGTLTDVQASGDRQRASLTFTTAARDGVITLYAKADGTYLTLYMNYGGNLVEVAMTKLPEKSFTLNTPVSITRDSQGVLTLFAEGDVGDYQAAVLVNGEEQNRYPLRYTGSGANALPYTIETYADGSSLHTLQVMVYNREDNPEWTSREYTLIHTNLETPQPRNLEIRITNMNATYEVEWAGLDFLTGEYRPMRFVVPDWNYNDDGTLAQEITFDYALSVTNPELIKKGEIILKVFCKEIAPYIREVKLYYNEMTDTFDGTLSIPGGTITVDDLPYGFSLDYSVNDTAVEPQSPQFLLDRGNRDMKAWQELLNIETEEVEPINLDHLYHWMEEEGITGDEREQILQMAALNNEIADTLAKIKESMQGIADTLFDRSSAQSMLELIQQYLERSDVSGSVEPLSESVTRDELLEWGFQEMQFEMGVIYILSGQDFSQMVWLDPENPGNGLVLTNGTPQMFLAQREGTDGPSSSAMETLIRQSLGLIATLSGAVTVSVDETTELLKTLSKQLGNYKEAEEILGSDHWKTYGKLRDNHGVLMKDMTVVDEIHMNKQIGELQVLKRELEAVEKAAEAGDIYTLRLKMPLIKGWATGASKVAGGMAKFIPVAGTVIGGAMAVWDLISICTGIYDRDKDLDKIWADYDRFDALIHDLPEGVCHNQEKYEICSEGLDDYWEEVAELQATTIAYYTGKVALLTVDVGTIIASLAVGVGNVVAGVLGLGSAGIGLGMDFAFEYDWKESKNEIHEAVMDTECTEIFEPCEDDDESEETHKKTNAPTGDDPEYRTPPKPMIDPSGYVYEAVESNWIQGATAQVYYRDAEGNEMFWDEAPQYDEINPQTTDNFGAYGWMTPPGKWLVKITKDGYLPADSRRDPASEDGWLPVPPPQLNVNIPLVSEHAPEVVSAAVAANQAQVVFIQYMEVSQFTDGNLLTVTQNGENIPVTCTFIDAEVSPTDASVYYGRILTLTRMDGHPFSGDGIEIQISNNAKNYAEKTLETAYESGELTISQILGSLSHSYPNRYVTDIAQSEEIVVQVLDTEGLPMANVVVTAKQQVGGTMKITESSVSDADGRAIFTVKGISSGYDTVVFEAGIIRADMNTRVSPLVTTAPKKPTANLSDYQTVEVGTELVLSCETEGAVIYYTTDNTCPCQEGESQILYTGPIPVTETALFRIASYTEEGGYSERLNLHILVEAEDIHICNEHLTRVEAKPADCAVNGNIEYWACSCGKYFEDASASVEITDKNSVIIKAGHTYGALIEEVPPVHTVSELMAGMKAHYYCSECDSYFSAEKLETTEDALVIPAPVHDYASVNGYKEADGHANTCSCGAHDTVAGHTPNIPAATETQDQKCSVCGYVMATATGHIHTNHLTRVEAKPADCAVNGNIEYWACSCGKYFEDASASVEITDKNSVIIKAGHTYGALIEEVPPVHTVSELMAGMKAHYYCSECDSYFSAEKLETTEDALVIPAPVHDYATVNGYKEADGHANTCSCGAHDTVAGHTPNIPAATETQDQKCSVCGYVMATATGHIHTNHLTRVEAKSADCTVDGNIEYWSCSCGKYFEDATASVEITDKDSVVIKADHEYGTLVAEVPALHTATELKPGMAAHYFCNKCDTYFTAEKVETTEAALVIPAPVHDYATVNGYKEADGHADTCSCGAHNTVVGHTPDIPTATETQDQKCSVCGYVMATATGHIHKDHLTRVEAKPAGCTVDGNIEYWSCSCGKYFEDATASVEITDKDSVVIKADHEYGTLIAEVPALHTATELKPGMAAHYFCDKCDTYFTAEKVETTEAALVIPAPVHDYATVNGYKEADGHADTCSCGAHDTVAGHTPNIPAATETQDQKCSVCGYVMATATGHIHTNHLTRVEAKPADCAVNGNIEYWACSCGKYFEDASASVEITDKNSVIIKAGHTYGALIEEVPPVHTVSELMAGMKAHYYCSECDSYFSAEKLETTEDALVIPAPVHDYATVNGYKEADGHANTCSCGAHDTVAGHTPNIPAATETQDQKCSVCGYVMANRTQNSSGGGSGGYTPISYTNTVADTTNGTVTVCPQSAAKGEIVTVTIVPDSGFALETLTVTDKHGKEIELTNTGDGKYAFKMPTSTVTVTATFMDDSTMPNFFVDVPADAYYYDAVLWAVKGGITSGTSATTFSSDNPCTRAQMATFLWRAVGSPDPVSKTCIFTDVPADAYYAKAVQWAYEQGITSGTSATTYSPDEACTRGQMATFLCRMADGKPVNDTVIFADIKADQYYAKAVQWAYEQKITAGTSATTFSPDNPCTRAQMVAFLYRYFVK